MDRPFIVVTWCRDPWSKISQMTIINHEPVPWIYTMLLDIPIVLPMGIKLMIVNHSGLFPEPSPAISYPSIPLIVDDHNNHHQQFFALMSPDGL